MCDKARFVQDVTIPDGTIVAPGTSISKTWRLKNVGTCTWTTGYTLVFDHGASLGSGGQSPNPVAFPAPVAPGYTVDVTVNLVGPSSPGNYQADFRLRSASGNLFGVGSSGMGTFWVRITVPPPTSYP